MQVRRPATHTRASTLWRRMREGGSARSASCRGRRVLRGSCPAASHLHRQPAAKGGERGIPASLRRARVVADQGVARPQHRSRSELNHLIAGLQRDSRLQLQAGPGCRDRNALCVHEAAVVGGAERIHAGAGRAHGRVQASDTKRTCGDRCSRQRRDEASNGEAHADAGTAPPPAAHGLAATGVGAFSKFPLAFGSVLSVTSAWTLLKEKHSCAETVARRRSLTWDELRGHGCRVPGTIAAAAATDDRRWARWIEYWCIFRARGCDRQKLMLYAPDRYTRDGSP